MKPVKISRTHILIFLLVGIIAISSLFQLNKDTNESKTKDLEEDKTSITQTPSEPTDQSPSLVLPSRNSMIPDDIEKITPEMDINPPKSLSPEYYDPIPVPGLVNTPGGEDSGFIMPDGDTLYFFFTPDV